MADRRLFGGTGEFPYGTEGYTTQRRNADGLPLGAELVVDSLPVVGDVKGGIETADYFNKGDYVNAGISGAATALALPFGLFGVGGMVRQGVKQGLKAVSKQYNNASKVFKKLNLDDTAITEWKAANQVQQRQKQIPELAEAARQVQQGNLSSAQYREMVDNYLPIKPLTEMPKMPTKKEIALSLTQDKVDKGIVGLNKSFKDGERISSRLDIPAYDNYDTWVVSLHDGTSTGGQALGYAQTAVLKNVDFKSSPKGAINIASEKTNKSTIARIYGDWKNENPEEVYKRAAQILEESKKPDSEWVQVGMNPYRASYFYDKATGLPVTGADEVIQVGPLVLAKNVKKASPDDPMFSIKSGDATAPTFAVGGLAIGSQEKDDEMFSNPLLQDPFDYVGP
jgi:hypothetical protein